MKTLRFSLATFLLLLAFNIVSAQTNTLDTLMSMKWQRDFGNNKSFSIYLLFSTNRMIGVLTFDNTIEKQADTYYLSDSVESVFKKNKVGKVVSGKYIISLDSSGKIMSQEIKYLDNTKLIIKPIYDSALGESTFLTYFAVPK